ncbi:hypothetical protein Gogos_020228 [Gossypium gossypioides]|uniref:Uncharacterized protein n=1 Tax=Gossypium gossypioides TaxID=34282 RepID=A0A7J9D2L2_GOSGO|nr:hypothetical protein [Gossypium gossypioides]
MSELWDFTRISVTQNNLQEFKEMWDQWDDETKQLFKREIVNTSLGKVYGI